MYTAETLVMFLSVSLFWNGNAQPTCEVGPEIQNFDDNKYMGSNGVFIMARHGINCIGVVSKWTFWAQHTGRFMALVLRPESVGNSNKWTVVGHNDVFVSEVDLHRQSVFVVPENELIEVDSGDVIGLAVGTHNPQIEAYDTLLTSVSQYANIADTASLIAGKVVNTVASQWECAIAATISDSEVIEANECESGPCQNGGTCEDGIDIYTCHCTAGYNGRHCEQDIDVCASSPCINGQCQDDNDQFICECDENWTGPHCNVFLTKACTTGERAVDRSRYLLGGFVHVFTRHPVSCDGRVSSWEFRAATSASFRAIIFRHAGGEASNTFVIVGINDIPTSYVRANRMSTYVVPYEQQIMAESGDFLGVALPGQGINPELQSESGSTYTTRTTMMANVTHLQRGDTISTTLLFTHHVSLSAIVSNAGCFIIGTPNDYSYQFGWPQIPAGVTSFVFGVRAESDAHIALSPIDAVADPMYEIVLGTDQNSKSLIRLCKLCNDEVIVRTPSILSKTEYREFLVSFEENTLEVSRVGSGPFISLHNPISFNLFYIGIATAWGSEGSWWFCGFASTSLELTSETAPESSTSSDETTMPRVTGADMKAVALPNLLTIVIVLAAVVVILVISFIACFCKNSCKSSPSDQPSSQISHIALTSKDVADQDVNTESNFTHCSPNVTQTHMTGQINPMAPPIGSSSLIPPAVYQTRIDPIPVASYNYPSRDLSHTYMPGQIYPMNRAPVSANDPTAVGHADIDTCYTEIA